MMRENKCQICDEDVDINSGGAALMITFCRNHFTNMTNICFCKDCYNALLKEPIKRLADAACVEWYGIDETEEKNEQGNSFQREAPSR